MLKRFIGAGAFAAASCLWWLGVAVYFIIENEPGPFDPAPFFNWDQMVIVYEIAPWIAVPFAALVVWVIAERVSKRSFIYPAWLTWACGGAALLWIGVAVWRGHEQVVSCVLWAPPAMYGGPDCSLSALLLGRLEWFAVPVAAWLVLAALRSSPSALMRSSP